MTQTNYLETAKQALALYANAVAELELMNAALESAVTAVIPAEVQMAIDEVKAEYEAKIEPLVANVEQLADVVKESAANVEATVKGSGYMAVYSKGRPSWNDDGLIKLAEQYPPIVAMRKEGKPSVSIRRAS